ncbi:MAG: sulfatase, partial [Lentisphaeria bacterium]|nr:sulfatase [Lentisphaeria bacterium]
MRVLFLDLDTLRPDHLGCYGYHRDTSPNIDRVARDGVRFDNYYCSDAPCLPSRASLVSGQFGIRNGVVGHGGTAADMRLEGEGRGFRDATSSSNLWMTFRKKGFRTVSISPFAERHSAWWFQAGMNETINTGKGGMESAEEITPSVMDWLDHNAQSDNWLLHINYWDSHTPYRAPDEFGNPFENDPLPSWMTPEIIETDRSLPGGHGAREVAMWNDNVAPRFQSRHPGQIRDMNDWRRMIDGYDCGTRYMDGHIGQILQKLEDAGIYDDTAIIITSDHGEDLGELGCYGEHGCSDYITHRVPMIIKWPGCIRGSVAEGMHYNIDLAPTVADLLSAQKSSRWQGASYARTLTDGEDCGHDYLVLGQCCHGAMRSVRFGPWMYIRVIHDFYHLYPREMLFNVELDPHETSNLAAEHPEICAEACRMMMMWWEDNMMDMPDDRDPLWTVMREGGPFHSKGHLP